jgi:hypothetical protein
MAGFRKAKAEQAAIKMGIYGPSGSGKTFTSLLIAEGLGKTTGKRVAYVDTEHGTDFYCQAIKDRAVHPEAFDFDAMYTRSISEVITAVKGLSPNEYGVIVIDSITHIWEACRNAYSGKTTRAGTIPMHAWGSIKKPYKDLMNFLLSSPMHVIFCGRQGNEYETNEDTDELKCVGVKMKAEGETPYEPHILLRMESIRSKNSREPALIRAFAEKDRTGVLAGKTFDNPNFETLGKPILACLGGTQAVIANDDDTAQVDSEAFAEQARLKEIRSKELHKEFSALISLCKTQADLDALGKKITPQVKDEMLTEHLKEVRELFLDRQKELKG